MLHANNSDGVTQTCENNVVCSAVTLDTITLLYKNMTHMLHISCSPDNTYATELKRVCTVTQRCFALTPAKMIKRITCCCIA